MVLLNVAADHVKFHTCHSSPFLTTIHDHNDHRDDHDHQGHCQKDETYLQTQLSELPERDDGKISNLKQFDDMFGQKTGSRGDVP